LRCRSCGDLVDPRRVELGYDYCLKEECQRECLERVRLAAIGINKAADYYVRAEEILPPPGPAMTPVEQDDAAVADVASRPLSHPTSGKKADTRPETTLERLRRLEADLDQALERSYERFWSGELTAREMDRERDRLVEAFNRQVLSENIRYRSMLRRRSDARRSG
jgi:hypothetical protein